MNFIFNNVTNTKVFFILGSVIMFYFFIVSYTEASKRNEIKKNGKLIEVTLLSLPTPCNVSSNLDFKFKYLNEIYSMELKNNICEYETGKKVELYHYNKYPKHFIFPQDNVKFDYIPSIFSLIFAILPMIVVFTGGIKKYFEYWG